MKKVAVLAATLLLVAIAVGGVAPSAYAHRDVEKGDVRITTGWGVEPPLLGQPNTVIIIVSQNDERVINALVDSEISIRKGGVSKTLDFAPTEEEGFYAADIIPTQLGQYVVVISGNIAGRDFDEQIQIEDVEDTRSLNFPESGGNPGIPDDFVEQMRGVITELTTQVEEAKGSSQQARDAAASAAESATEIKASADRAYLVGMAGIGVGAAGIAIAVVALRRA